MCRLRKPDGSRQHLHRSLKGSNGVLYGEDAVLTSTAFLSVDTLARVQLIFTATAHSQYCSAQKHTSNKAQWPAYLDNTDPRTSCCFCPFKHETLKIPVELAASGPESQIWYWHDQRIFTRSIIRRSSRYRRDWSQKLAKISRAKF